MDFATPLAWNDDVLLIPVGELSDEMRAQIDCEPEDFALSRPQARTGSKILDADSADLVARFREPRTLVEAVILFGRQRGLEPDQVLEGAFPLISGLVQGGFLVPAAGEGGRGERRAAKDGTPERRGFESRWRPGDPLLDGRVERVLQVLEDTEVYLLARPVGPVSVVKVERRRREGARPRGLAERLEREATFLSHLDAAGATGSGQGGAAGSLAPRLRRLGEVEGRSYLEMEHVPGLDALAAGAEWRKRGAAGRSPLLALCRAVAAAFASLHERGVLHGDVHPSNVRVGRDGAVRLIDFGLASAGGPGSALPLCRERGGIPFFYEPELARAFAQGSPPPPPTPAGEQHAVAALLYALVAGAHPRDYSLGREEMLRELAEEPPLPFSGRGVESWPDLEAVLRRALAKAPGERYPSMAAFAAALEGVETGAGAATPGGDPAPPHLRRLIERTLAAASIDGPWLREGIHRAPTASINYGAAGVALGLLQTALQRDSPALLPLADLWARRAALDLGRDEGFFEAGIQITREMVGEASPFHSPSGVHAVAALVARASGDPYAHAAALERYLEAAERPGNGLDLTLGRAATLLGAAILLDTVPPSHPGLRPPAGGADPAPLEAFGDRATAALWRELDAKPAIAEADVEYAGIAHGWAGFLYATLLWCDVAGRPIPAGVPGRLAELARLAVPAGRGLQWPWTLRGEGRTTAMPGWCNGSTGYVFLWTLAHRLLGEAGHLDLAAGAAIDAYDSPETFGSLCCGGAGRAYALLNLHRHTGEAVWLERARDVARRCAAHGKTQDDYPHSLWKGELGLAVLAADLERPERAAMPFFEPLGYRRGRALSRGPEFA